MQGVQAHGIDAEICASLARQVKEVHDLGVDIGLVIGGGNIFRGQVESKRFGLDRSVADYMGMLATVINGLALQNALEKVGLPTRVLTALGVHSVAEPYIRRRAMRHFEKRRVIIFVAGTGNPYFTTDTAAALRAQEIDADVILKATKVDGIYTADPVKDPTATRYDKLTYSEALNKQLKVMDAAAFSLCMENNIPIVVFNFFEEGEILRVFRGEDAGTLVTYES